MSEADLTRAIILEGAEQAAEASKLIEKTKVAGIDMNDALNSAKQAIMQQIREILVAIARIRDAQATVAPYVAGSGIGYVSTGNQFLDRADQELQDTARNLKMMHRQIEDWQKQILPVIDRNLSEQSGRAREASAQFRAYVNVL